MNQPDPIQTYLVEADDLLGQVEETVIDAAAHREDREAVNRLFRAFHTIKGSGAMFGFDHVAAFTHHVESALDRVRTGHLSITDSLVQLVLAARDEIKAMLENGGRPASRHDELIRAFQALEAGTESPVAPKNQAPQVEAAPPNAGKCVYRIRFRPPSNIATLGLDPLTILEELAGLGFCTSVAHTDTIPPLEQLRADDCYLSWDISLSTDRGLNAVRDAFAFVEDVSELSIEEVPSATRPKEHGTDPEPAAVAKAHAPTEGTSRPAAREATVRVGSAKLDRLVNLVGEMVMNQSRLIRVAERLNDSELGMSVEAIERLVAELRDTVLGIRMMPIGSTFSRFKRLVHDLSTELGKKAQLETEGAETELDKTVLDQLGDPLVHLIRNAIDHGLETEAERTLAGKAPVGTVRLSASHEGAHVIVSISDDGRGIPAEKVRAKAVERGLIQPDAKLSEQEIFGLIFLPGFSTADKVTNVSGRGVGMDVVKRQIDALRGAIEIASKPGLGTTISLTLPLTLAIIDGLLVEVGGDNFIIPMSLVAENVERTATERHKNNGRNVIAVRGDLLSCIRLREMFAMAEDGPELEKVVLVRHAGERVGIVVDRVLGSHQTVIQALGEFYRDVEILSGATIMGDGRVALILDVPGIVRFAEQAQEA